MNWTNNNLSATIVSTLIHGVKLHIELDRVNIVQQGNITNLLSVTNSELNLTEISMNHSKIEKVFSGEQVSLVLTDSDLNLSNSYFSSTDKNNE